MTTYAIEGQGATIAFGSSTFVSDLLSFNMPERTREVLETTHLGTTVAKTFKPAKVKTIGDISCEFDHNPGAADLLNNAIETITVNYPLLTGQSVAAKLVFSGFVIQQGGEEFKTDTKLTTKVTIKVSGDLAYTAAT